MGERAYWTLWEGVLQKYQLTSSVDTLTMKSDTNPLCPLYILGLPCWASEIWTPIRTRRGCNWIRLNGNLVCPFPGTLFVSTRNNVQKTTHKNDSTWVQLGWLHHCSCNAKNLSPTIFLFPHLGKGPHGSCFFWVSWASLMPPKGIFQSRSRDTILTVSALCPFVSFLTDFSSFMSSSSCLLVVSMPRRLWRRAQSRSPASAVSFSCCYFGSVVSPKDIRQWYLFIYVAQRKAKFFS